MFRALSHKFSLFFNPNLSCRFFHRIKAGRPILVPGSGLQVSHPISVTLSARSPRILLLQFEHGGRRFNLVEDFAS